MFNTMQRHHRHKSEAEKPFWISYADLMTGIMVLFMVTMATVMVMITHKVHQVQSREVLRAKQVLAICREIQQSFSKDDVIHVDCQNNRISFGEIGRFAFDDYHLPAAAAPALARVIPAVLKAADNPLGRKWFKQVVIEGFTDVRGSYLYNLDLSLKRSEWVMCLLLDERLNRHLMLNPEQLQRVRHLFLVGGVSFNHTKATHDASRRVELQLQFYGLDADKTRTTPVVQHTATNRCMLR